MLLLHPMVRMGLLGCALVVGLAGCGILREKTACTPHPDGAGKPMTRTQLAFPLRTADRKPIWSGHWSHFVRTEVIRRFGSNITITSGRSLLRWPATAKTRAIRGLWQITRVITWIHKGGPAENLIVEQVRRAWRTRFPGATVVRLDERVCVTG